MYTYYLLFVLLMIYLFDIIIILTDNEKVWRKKKKYNKIQFTKKYKI